MDSSLRIPAPIRPHRSHWYSFDKIHGNRHWVRAVVDSTNYQTAPPIKNRLTKLMNFSDLNSDFAYEVEITWNCDVLMISSGTLGIHRRYIGSRMRMLL